MPLLQVRHDWTWSRVGAQSLLACFQQNRTAQHWSELFLRPVAGEDRRWVGSGYRDRGRQATAIPGAGV